MGEQAFDRIKKLIAILLAVFFLISVTASSISAAPPNPTTSSEYKRGYDDGYKDGYKDGSTIGIQKTKGAASLAAETDYSRGYAAGYDDGFKTGLNASKVKPATPTPTVKSTTGDPKEEYNRGFREGYRDGYRDGYSEGSAIGSQKAQGAGLAETDYSRGYSDGYDAGFKAGLETAKRVSLNHILN